MSLTNSQYFSINITLNKAFLKWVHSHRLVDGELGSIIKFGIDIADKQKFAFGGKYGNQFNTVDEVKSFNVAFDRMLEKHKVNSKHKNSLFYLMSFLNEDYEQQSIKRNLYNQLIDYSKFLLNLIADSLAHIERMRRNTAYVEVHDIYTLEFFFVKKEIVSSMPYEDLLTYVPNSNDADQVVKYLRINLFQDGELYVPEDLIINISSDKTRSLRSLDGSSVNNFTIPKQLTHKIFTNMVKSIISLHNKHNTKFYQDLISNRTTLNDFVYIKNINKKNKLSYSTSFARVGTLVTDYLLKHNLFTSKRSIANFLFSYFALFKAIPLKHPASFPDNYEDLIPFYLENGIDGETIRNRMKDAGDF